MVTPVRMMIASPDVTQARVLFWRESSTANGNIQIMMKISFDTTL
jgi:hypothetical protein